MAEDYPVLVGVVQKFPDSPAVAERTVQVQNEDTVVREFTVKAAGSQALVRVSLWPPWGDVAIEEGDAIIANGKFTTQEGKSTTFYNLNPFHLHVNGQKQVADRTDAPEAKPARKVDADAAPF